MSFKKIGSPVNMEIVNFKKTSTVNICCKACGKNIGRRNGQYVKFSKSSVVVVSPQRFVCPECGAISTSVDEGTK